jgi:hypothetical protein
MGQLVKLFRVRHKVVMGIRHITWSSSMEAGMVANAKQNTLSWLFRQPAHVEKPKQQTNPERHINACHQNQAAQTRTRNLSGGNALEMCNTSGRNRV